MDDYVLVDQKGITKMEKKNPFRTRPPMPPNYIPFGFTL